MDKNVGLEDSGEFLLVARDFGAAHPPGYLIYTWLGGMINFLPVSNLATKIHFLSALCGTACISFTYSILHTITARPLLAFFGALTALLAPTLAWTFTTAEIYSLVTLVTLFSLWIILKRDLQRGYWFAGLCFLWGFGLSVHWPLFLLTLPAFVLFIPRRSLRDYGIAAGCFVFGLVPFVLLWIPPLGLSAFGRIDSLSQWIAFVAREAYGRVDYNDHAGWTDDWLFSKDFYQQLVLNFSHGIALMMGIGLLFLLRHQRKRFAFSLAWLLLCHNIVLRLFLNTEFNILFAEITRAYQSIPLIAACLLAWIGLHYVLIRLSWITFAMIYPILATILFTGLAVHIYLTNPQTFSAGDEQTFAADIAQLYLSLIPENQVVFLHGDSDIGPLTYAQQENKVRPDLILLSQNGFLLRPPTVDRVDEQWQNHALDAIRTHLKSGQSIYTIRTRPEFAALMQGLDIQDRNYGALREYCFPENCKGLKENGLYWILDFLNKYSTRPYTNTHWTYYQESLLGPLCKALASSGGSLDSVAANSAYCLYHKLDRQHLRGETLDPKVKEYLRQRVQNFPKDEREFIERANWR